MDAQREGAGRARALWPLVVGTALGFSLAQFVLYTIHEVIHSIRAARTDEEFPSVFGAYDLSFEVRNTEIYYGQTLAGLIAVFLLAVAALIVWRRRRAPARPMRECRHCLSPVPLEALVCSHCTRDLEPNPPGSRDEIAPS